MHRLTPLAVLTACAMLAGCHDGPLFALKTINPVYRSQWAEDEKLGPTDAQRLEELQRLVTTMPSLSDADQDYWLQHIEAILENDKNPEMRTHAIRALEKCRSATVLDVCEKQLDDESIKVRMAVCDVLATHDSARSTELLGRTIGSESNEDVKMAAIAAVGRHRSSEAAQTLKASLRSRNPAIRVAAVESLSSCTGKTLGEDPQVWVAYLEGKAVDEEKKSITRQMRDLF